MKIKIMSYNTQHCLNFVTREIDFDIIVDTIKRCGADVVGLQEIFDEGTDPAFVAQTKIIAERLGFYYYFAKAIDFDENNPYGIALVSRYPIISTEVVFIPDPQVRKYDGYYETRVLLKATIDAGGGLNVLVSHFGLNPDEHENAVQTVISNLSENRCVLMGDFNMEPDNPILSPIMHRLYDTAQNFSSPKLSFPSDTPTVKIDYIFVSKDLRVQYADIPEIVSSDHRPHIATIESESV
jgi:endonuclease/exonuclease/phosphatase family metal-dependent hydrolase